MASWTRCSHMSVSSMIRRIDVTLTGLGISTLFLAVWTLRSRCRILSIHSVGVILHVILATMEILVMIVTVMFRVDSLLMILIFQCWWMHLIFWRWLWGVLMHT